MLARQDLFRDANLPSMFEVERTEFNYNNQLIGMADENDIIGSASEIIKGKLFCLTLYLLMENLLEEVK